MNANNEIRIPIEYHHEIDAETSANEIRTRKIKFRDLIKESVEDLPRMLEKKNSSFSFFDS